VSMDTDERLSSLEERLEKYDRLVQKLVAFARLSPAGRLVLKGLGL
jgi:hypothetical protein